MILLPPSYCYDKKPVVFLAGPIQGADNWQSDAAKKIDHEDVIVASPRGVQLDDASHFGQIDWEHFYLEEAAQRGVTLFWLAREAQHICTRAYAQTTRFELAEALSRTRYEGTRVIVGIDPEFSGGRYIEYTINKKYPSVPVYRSLDQACSAAAIVALRLVLRAS